MDKIETPLGDLSRLNPQPGDVFVLETPADFKMAAIDQTLMATEFEQECDGAVERAIQSRMGEKLRDLMAADDAQREAAIIHGDPSGVKPIGVIDASGEEPYVGMQATWIGPAAPGAEFERVEAGPMQQVADAFAGVLTEKPAGKPQTWRDRPSML